jgi:glycosyltransferase involved in cell wall biosynthesis
MAPTLSGGMRNSSNPPAFQPGLPVISVITVVFNSVQLLERTISSILEQTYPNIEYLIIDGGSTDGTLDIIRKYENQIAFWTSGPDKGLYDAMNKGLQAATGDYVWFLNSGDLPYERETLTGVFKGPGAGSPGAIYYGDTMVVDSDYKEVGLRRLRPPEHLTWKSFRKGMLVCHQAILVSRRIAPEFNLKYPHSADFEWVIQSLKRASGHEGISGVVNTHQVLCRFLDGGQSKRTIRVSLLERFDIMRRNYGLIPTVLRHIPIAIRFAWFISRNRRF